MPIVRIEKAYYFEEYNNGQVTSRDFLGLTLREARRNVNKIVKKRRVTQTPHPLIRFE
jgi:hypothetical protein